MSMLGLVAVSSFYVSCPFLLNAVHIYTNSVNAAKVGVEW